MTHSKHTKPTFLFCLLLCSSQISITILMWRVYLFVYLSLFMLHINYIFKYIFIISDSISTANCMFHWLFVLAYWHLYIYSVQVPEPAGRLLVQYLLVLCIECEDVQYLAQVRFRSLLSLPSTSSSTREAWVDAQSGRAQSTEWYTRGYSNPLEHYWYNYR